ncbi:MAG TPA: tyrosine-type recombinase/integrase [Bryobacteraceae bacterium]|nr:tyrosine-type recombinase/integrase [Bryobacteraceae bacterium]
MSAHALAAVPTRLPTTEGSGDLHRLLAFVRPLVMDAVGTSSRRIYASVIDDFAKWSLSGNRPLTKATVQSYRVHLEAQRLAPATINLRLSAVRRLATEAADNGLLDPNIASGIARAKGAKVTGVRTGNWLTKAQAEQLLNTPDLDTRKGKRDVALLSVLLGCGLRREEAARLTFDHVQQREGRWVIVDLIGKGNRTRTVPMPSWAKAAIDEWQASAGVTEGCVLRPVNKGDRLAGESMTPQAIFTTVVGYTRTMGMWIAPHDLRRTFAKLAHKGNSALEQIQLSLGHASIQTTERYLGVKQDLADAPCDHLRIKPQRFELSHNGQHPTVKEKYAAEPEADF